MLIASGVDMAKHRILGEEETELTEVIFSDSRFSTRLAYGKTPRPPYAYGMYQAALLAERLGLSKISAIEFGVAGGIGLLAMEKIAQEVEKEVSVEFEIYGFDTGSGLPEPIDYRDLPYIFRRGDYKMDEAKLRARLNHAKLVIGNVSDTVPSFFENYNPAPIGFVSIDLDFYSSTVDALILFDMNYQYMLPRVFCFFDDIISSDLAIHNEWVGELRAIKEFNEKHKLRKIAPIYGLRHHRNLEKSWSEKVVAVRLGIEMSIPSGHKFILVGEVQRKFQSVGDRHPLPFLERNGCYWGAPPDSSTAVSELERMRQVGVEFIVFAWPALWWLDYYADFNRYLRSKFRCLLDTTDIVVFDIRHSNRLMLSLEWIHLLLFRRLVTNKFSKKHHENTVALVAERDELWNDKIFVLHVFDHLLYNQYIHPEEKDQLPLE